MRREVLVVLAGLLLTVILSACGGSKNMGILEPAQVDDGRNTAGVTLGEFEVIRCDEMGRFEPALNDTLSLRLEEGNGSSALVISVDDAELVNNVAVEVRFGGESVHVDRAEFSGIFGVSEVIEGKFLGVSGKAGIAQVCIGNAPVALEGDFARVYFADGPSRTVSAPAGIHGGDVGEILYADDENLPNFAPTSDTTAKVATITWYGAYHKADGNQDSLITVGDITPIGVYYNQNVGTNWVAALADYKPDRLIEVGDITPIGVNYDHGTEGFRVEVSDDSETDYSSAALTLIKNVSWNDPELNPQDTTGAVAAGALWPVFNQWNLEVTEISDFTWDELAAPNLNGNDLVRVWITPYDGTQDSTIHAFADINVTTVINPVQDVFVIQDVQVQVAGTDNGEAEDADIYSETMNEGSVVANAEGVDMSFYSLSGTFNALPFDGLDPDNWPEGLTQAIYDQAVGLATAAATWDIDHADAAVGFRRTEDWLVRDTGNWGTAGDPGTADVFPDYDPDSESPAFEGGLNFTLGAATFYDEADVLQIVSYTDKNIDMAFDVTKDFLPPEISMYGEEGNPITELMQNEPTTLIIPFKWGTNGAPADNATTALELHEIDPGTGISQGVAEDLVFTVDENPTPGFFSVFDIEDALWLTANVPAGNLSPGGSYAFRYQADGLWSTINLPADLLTVAPPPPPQELEVLPELLFQDIDELQFFYEDPVVRRLPDVYYDTDSSSLLPVDEGGYNDILKTNGDEFVIQVAGGIWPQVAIVETASPNNINQISDGMAGIIPYLPSPGRLRCDVGIITTAGNPGDPVENYSFKWFNPDGSVVGQGTFDYNPVGNYNVQPAGTRWAVNVINRAEGDPTMASNWADKNIVDGGTVGIDAPSPDVLWFEFAGGYNFETDQDAEVVYGALPTEYLNTTVHVVDSDTSEDFYMGLGLRVIGLSDSGGLIAIHSLTMLSWTRPGIPGWPGKLETGKTFDLWLDDPAFAGGDGEYHYATPLFVTGPNPNVI